MCTTSYYIMRYAFVVRYSTYVLFNTYLHKITENVPLKTKHNISCAVELRHRVKCIRLECLRTYSYIDISLMYVRICEYVYTFRATGEQKRLTAKYTRDTVVAFILYYYVEFNLPTRCLTGKADFIYALILKYLEHRRIVFLQINATSRINYTPIICRKYVIFRRAQLSSNSRRRSSISRQCDV